MTPAVPQARESQSDRSPRAGGVTPWPESHEHVVTAGLTRRRFLQVTGATGVAAFLAACAGGTGTTEPRATDTTTASIRSPRRPRPADAPPPYRRRRRPSRVPSSSPTGAPTSTSPARPADSGSTPPARRPPRRASRRSTASRSTTRRRSTTTRRSSQTITPALVDRRADRLGPHRHDRLVRRPAHQQGLGRADRPRPTCPTASSQPAGRAAEPAVGRQQRLPLPLAVGHDRASATTRSRSPRTRSPAPTKLADLWTIDPAKVEFLTEARDTFGLALLKLGIDPDPATVTADDLQAVHDDIQPLVDKGLRFLGQGYLQYFGGKGVWAGFVWSGDLAIVGQRGRPVRLPRGGHDDLDRQHDHPQGCPEQVHRRAHDELRLRPEGRGPDRRLRRTTSRPSQGAARRDQEARSGRPPPTRCSSRGPTSSPSSTTSSS